MDAITLVQQCAPAIEPGLAIRLVRRESGFNPYAIGLDGNAVLTPQPRSFDAAVKTAEALIKARQTFSVGTAQIHISNVRKLGLTWEQAFDPCTNLRQGQAILQHFHGVALRAGLTGADAVFAALRGYNSGNIYGAVSNDYAAAIMGGGHSMPITNVQIRFGPLLTKKPAFEDGEAQEAFVVSGSMQTGQGGQSKEFFEN